MIYVDSIYLFKVSLQYQLTIVLRLRQICPSFFFPRNYLFQPVISHNLVARSRDRTKFCYYLSDISKHVKNIDVTLFYVVPSKLNNIELHSFVSKYPLMV